MKYLYVHSRYLPNTWELSNFIFIFHFNFHFNFIFHFSILVSYYWILILSMPDYFVILYFNLCCCLSFIIISVVRLFTFCISRFFEAVTSLAWSSKLSFCIMSLFFQILNRSSLPYVTLYSIILQLNSQKYLKI